MRTVKKDQRRRSNEDADSSEGSSELDDPSSRYGKTGIMTRQSRLSQELSTTESLENRERSKEKYRNRLVLHKKELDDAMTVILQKFKQFSL